MARMGTIVEGDDYVDTSIMMEEDDQPQKFTNLDEVE